MSHITNCRSCGSKELHPFLDFGKLPLANGLVTTKRRNKSYPLKLMWCSKCKLVQLDYTVDPKELFSNYVWVTGSSEMAKDHATRFYNTLVLEKLGPTQTNILEIGSNDGTFLQPFKKNGYSVLGIDPAENIAKIASENGIPTIGTFFTKELTKDFPKKFIGVDVIIARNVLPHVADPNDFLSGIEAIIHPKGWIVIEFHYAKKIMEELHYDSIYHEHLCYFTIETIESLLKAHGLYIHDIKESPISGGSLIIYCRPFKPGLLSLASHHILKRYKENEDNSLNVWETFGTQSVYHMRKFRDLMQKAKEEYGPIYGYGASARSSTLLNINEIKVKKIADINPLKQGKYTSGSHIPIISPEDLISEHPKCICVLAWNLSDEIVKTLRDMYQYEGPIIVPLPGDPKYVI